MFSFRTQTSYETFSDIGSFYQSRTIFPQNCGLRKISHFPPKFWKFQFGHFQKPKPKSNFRSIFFDYEGMVISHNTQKFVIQAQKNFPDKASNFDYFKFWHFKSKTTHTPFLPKFLCMVIRLRPLLCLPQSLKNFRNLLLDFQNFPLGKSFENLAYTQFFSMPFT